MDFQSGFLCNHSFACIFLVYLRLLLRCFDAEFGLQHGKLGQDYQDDFRDKRIAKFSSVLYRFAECFVGFFAVGGVCLLVRDSISAYPDISWIIAVLCITFAVEIITLFIFGSKKIKFVLDTRKEIS